VIVTESLETFDSSPLGPIYLSLRDIKTTVSTWPELPLLMSWLLGTCQSFFSVFVVCGNISMVL